MGTSIGELILYSEIKLGGQFREIVWDLGGGHVKKVAEISLWRASFV